MVSLHFDCSGAYRHNLPFLVSDIKELSYHWLVSGRPICRAGPRPGNIIVNHIAKTRPTCKFLDNLIDCLLFVALHAEASLTLSAVKQHCVCGCFVVVAISGKTTKVRSSGRLLLSVRIYHILFFIGVKKMSILCAFQTNSISFIILHTYRCRFVCFPL